MGRVLFVASAAIVGALLSAGAFVLLTGAAFFQPEAYSDANDWFGLALIGDIEAVLAAFLVVFGLAAGLSDGRRTFGFMVAGIAASFVLVAALVFSWRPAPRLLRADDQLYLVGGWALLALGLAAVGRALARRRG